MPISSSKNNNPKKFFEKNIHFYKNDNIWNIPIRSCFKNYNAYHKNNIKKNKLIKKKIKIFKEYETKEEFEYKKENILICKEINKINYNNRLSERLALELRTKNCYNKDNENEIIDIDPWETKKLSLNKSNINKKSFNHKPNSIWNNYCQLNKKYINQIFTKAVLRGEEFAYNEIKKKIKIENYYKNLSLDKKQEIHDKIREEFKKNTKLLKYDNNKINKNYNVYNATLTNFYNTKNEFSLENKFLRTQKLSLPKKKKFRINKNINNCLDLSNMPIMDINDKTAIVENSFMEKFQEIPIINKKLIKLKEKENMQNSSRDSILNKDDFRKTYFRNKIWNINTESNNEITNNKIKNIQNKILNNKNSNRNSPKSNIKSMIKNNEFTMIGKNIIKIKKKLILNKQFELKKKNQINYKVHKEIDIFEKNWKNRKKISLERSKVQRFKKLDKNFKHLFDKYPNK